MQRQLPKSFGRTFTLFSLFMGIPLLAAAQSPEMQINHLNHCTDLLNQDNHLSDGTLAVMQMIDYERGTLTFGSEDMKSEMIRKVEDLESENSTSDLEALKKKLLEKRLDVARETEAECADLDHDNVSRPFRLNEIGDILNSLGQAEDALPILRRCTEQYQDFALCFESMGEALLALNRQSEAREAFKRTEDIGGFNEWNSKAIKYAKGWLDLMDREDQSDKGGARAPEANQGQHSFGTGFFVSSDGELLTNNHVVSGCRNLTIENGLPVQVITRDPSSDLALLKANLKPGQIAVFRSGPVPKVGDAVVTFGFPLPGILSSEGNVATGIISAATGLQNDVRFVQISAPVQPGNSGGPVFDTSGHVIGIVVAKLDALRVAQITGDVPQNVNFAVHWSEIRALLDEQGVRYKKLPSQQAIDTRAIARIGAGISVTLDCTQ
jgi:S1-C subfamily serine protease